VFFFQAVIGEPLVFIKRPAREPLEFLARIAGELPAS
jgi:hypothetical protein